MKKSLVAGAVSLALGTSMVAAPIASAAPQSPPAGANAGTCSISASVEQAVGLGNAKPKGASGLLVGIDTEYTPGNNAPFTATPWVKLGTEDDRLFAGASAAVTTQIGGVLISGIQGTKLDYNAAPLDSSVSGGTVNQTTPPSKQSHTIRIIGTGDTFRAAPSAPGIYGWTVSSNQNARNNLNENGRYARVTLDAVATIKPWPNENNNCQPMGVSIQEAQTVVPNGTLQATGAKVSGFSTGDTTRLTGVVTDHTGTRIEGATVSVADDGGVSISLPQGYRNSQRNVQVQVQGKPRQASDGSAVARYGQNQDIGNAFTIPVQTDNVPFIGSDGNWWVGDTNTGVKAQGPQGEPGKIINAPEIKNGTWWVGDQDLGISATGPAGPKGCLLYTSDAADE